MYPRAGEHLCKKTPDETAGNRQIVSLQANIAFSERPCRDSIFFLNGLKTLVLR
jgi:hypothetical protein